MNLIYKSSKLFRNQKNLLNLMPKYCFSLDLNNIDFSKHFTVKMEKNTDNEMHHLEFPNLEEPDSRPIVIQADSLDIGGLVEGLVEEVGYFNKLEAFTLDRKEMSKQTNLDDLEGDNFYLIDQKKRIFLIQNQDKFNIDTYQGITEFCNKIELSFLERKVISNYLRRFDDLNQQSLGQKIFSDKGQLEKNNQFNKADVIENLIAALPSHKNIQTENEEKLFNQYIELQRNIRFMKAQKAMLETLVHKQEKRKMGLGLLALIGQFSFVGIGTYSVWSWDLVEPMAFFLQFTGTAYLSFHFFKFQNDYDNNAYLDWRKNEALVKLAQSQGFNLQKLEELEEEFAKLERQIKANVLINL